MNQRHAFAPEPRAALLARVLDPIVAAAMRGQYELLLAETGRAVEALLPGTSARVLTHVGGTWREWSSVDATVGLPIPGAADWDGTRLDGQAFVPIVAGALGVLVDGLGAGHEASDDLDVFRQCASLALQTCERQRIAAQNLDEVQVLQRVATRMLKSHDLGEILLHITQEAKRLLSADICGVLLREGEQIVMRRCVGNHSPDTAALRMGPGQGLAGLVLARREPSAVEDYLSSEHISRDFFPLAQAELVRSALAAPLLGRDDMIGVLEVWRRHPSTFTALDRVRLVALANLTSIAIENAELYAAQDRMVDELGRANEALNQRYDTVRSLSNLTQTMMQILLQGGGLQPIAASAAGFLRSEVAVVDNDGIALAWSGIAEARAVLPRVPEPGAPPADPGRPASGSLALERDGIAWRALPVLVQGDAVGWALGRVGPGGADLAELTLTQVAMIAAVHRLEQRAASRARAESIDAIVWDLLQADEAVRAAAADRAADIRLDLSGPLRLFVCELGPGPAGSPDRVLSAMRAQVAGVIGAVKPSGVRAGALHGLSLAVLCADEPLDDAERLAQRLAHRLAEALAGRLVLIGGSCRCEHARGLSVAFREAQIALDVARQLRRTGSVVYDRAGVVGMLLGLRYEAGMQRFLELNFGRLLQEEDKQREQLMHTLRVFFDVNCSHEAAAQRLGVHRKTIGYRLTKISELTGLDFSTHDDRLVADLSLYVYGLISGPGPASKEKPAGGT